MNPTDDFFDWNVILQTKRRDGNKRLVPRDRRPCRRRIESEFRLDYRRNVRRRVARLYREPQRDRSDVHWLDKSVEELRDCLVDLVLEPCKVVRCPLNECDFRTGTCHQLGNIVVVRSGCKVGATKDD